MRFALFAADIVGLAAARTMAAHDVRPFLLCLDSNDRAGVNRAIRKAAGLTERETFTNEQLMTSATLRTLEELELDLGVSAWWPHILRPPVLKRLRLGALNIHPSFLPHGRGKDPNFWCLVEGSPFGVTIHWVTSQIDAGPIAFQSDPIEISWTDTGASLYSRALGAASSLFERSFPDIKEGRIPRIDQAPAGRAHRRAELEAASQIRLEDRYTARDLLNLLRARTFRPHPAAWFEQDGHRFEVRIEITDASRDASS